MASPSPSYGKIRRKISFSIVALIVFLGAMMRDTNSVKETQQSSYVGQREVFRSSSRQQQQNEQQQQQQQQQRLLEAEASTTTGIETKAQEVSENKEGENSQNHVVDRTLYGNGPRIGVFGESDSWGAGLSSKFDAYPYHLSASTKITNFAFYNAGPNYASVCTETLVGDDTMLDVILLEHYLRAPEGLVDLTTRLKQRFPQALFVFVKLWKPWMLYRKSSSDQLENGESLDEWIARLNLPKGQPEQPLYTPELYEGLQNDTEGGNLWHIPIQQTAEDALEQAMGIVGSQNGYLVTLPMDTNNVQQTLLQHLDYFDSRYGLLTTKAHTYISRQIDQVISEHVPSAEDVTANAQVGTWGNGDACHLWFESGSCPFSHSENFKMVQHSQDMEGNYVLELFPQEEEEEAWIDITNPFETERQLFLSYITSDGESHPKTMVKVHGQETIFNPQSLVDPKHVHPMKTSPLSIPIPPGTHKLQFQSLDVNTKYPFRLVGISFTDEVSVPLLHEFSPLMQINF
eukprot:CAMPEP_0195308746 /NCGR_PEP_ID=MMETSP0707-20130614/38383_1 /TAXON_ID=33640 /ORGANISM="Asterionellopsis glacialis, Strain CCMP134" /LENGTH=515 /DNA_ID=CAMNT_0040373029 /DNA_START=56 /DNA_END=1603 /DNA_ORIENTATION=+